MVDLRAHSTEGATRRLVQREGEPEPREHLKTRRVRRIRVLPVLSGYNRHEVDEQYIRE
jgi:hypothetical protein